MTFYYDPTIDHHHRLPLAFGGLFPAYYLAPQEPDDARALFDAAIAQLGLADPGPSVSPPGPRGTALVMHLAREWDVHSLAELLADAADENFEPVWDRERGEFTWGFGYNEEHPRGQHNAAMAAAEVMTAGAWWRLAHESSDARFDQPTVSGVAFPDLAVTQAWWDAERAHLMIATAPRNEADVGQPTSFTIANLPDPGAWTIDVQEGGEVIAQATREGLRIDTVIGAHRLVVRRV